MASISIRNIDASTEHDLAPAIRRFQPLGRVIFELPPREPMRDPPKPGT